MFPIELPHVQTPWSSVGYLTYKRTYSRDMGNDTTEEWPDTIRRTIMACRDQLKVGFTPDEESRLAHYMLALKGSVAGRFLWQLGTPTVDRFGLASLQNCAFTLVDHPIRPFCWAMNMLMLGSGVGFNIQRVHVDKLPEVRSWFEAPTRVDDFGADFIIPDSREGWCQFLGKTLKAAFLSETPEKGSFSFCTNAIRGKGAPIKGFGGTASGPVELCWGINEISKILMKRRGKKLRPIDALDIMNLIAYIVVAGNVRRSAQIAIGDPDDVEFLLAKMWEFGDIPSWRAMSNNSVVASSMSELHELFWKGYTGVGEPYGLINLELARACGRTGETQYKDPDVQGFNPCAEQGLADKETCCLAEVFLPNIESKEQLMDVVELLYRINKHSLNLPCHHPETQAIVHRNQRMGIGMTGLLQASKEQLSWLDETYRYLRDFDVEYSEATGFNPSIKLTTVKPSGTLSLLPGVTPGVHPGYARFMFRRIRIAANHPLTAMCRKHGYPVEYLRNAEGQDYNTVVVTFPFEYTEGTVLASQLTAIGQLDFVRQMQRLWSDNSVSCTVYYKIEELPTIRAYLERYYSDNFKTVSFLLHKGHGFDQAPYEEVTEEVFRELQSRVTPITHFDAFLEMDASDECAGGACPLR